jgi:hypothetical protein
VTPAEVTTDQTSVYSGMLEALLPAAWHRTDQYANNGIECDHRRLKAATYLIRIPVRLSRPGWLFRDRRPQPAVLVSPAFDRWAPGRAVSFLELCAIAIVPLQRYGWVRDLEYDDFPSSWTA